jgi:hypothetical protein
MDGSLSIFEMGGVELIKQKVQGLKVEINVSSLPVGIYYVRLFNENKFVVGKFVKN